MMPQVVAMLSLKRPQVGYLHIIKQPASETLGIDTDERQVTLDPWHENAQVLTRSAVLDVHVGRVTRPDVECPRNTWAR